ncbi:MAG: ATP-binding protein [Acidobacteriota bacterium]
MITELKQTGVDTGGLLQVLGQNLYSTPEVAVRELVQNAHDSCVRRRLEDKAPDAAPPRIDVTADPGGTLTILDTGAGLTREEVERYLATLGAGYTRILRRSSGDSELVGAFGLGFLSAYVISDLVEVTTTSYQDPGTTLLFRSRDGLRYSLSEAPSAPVGTRVRLTLKASHSQLGGPDYVARVLERYCCLLPTPIYAPAAINGTPPSWRVSEDLPELRRRKLHLETARRFERHFEPLCVWEVEPAPEFEVRGIVWLQDGGSWATSDTRRVSIFVRGMLVDDDAPRALPEWAGFAGAAIECNDLTPTASREAVQRDKAWDQLVEHLRQATVKGLVHVARTQPEAWRRVVARHNEALRAATLVEPALFDLLENQLQLPTSEGPMRLREVEKATPGRLFLTVGDGDGYETLIHRALSQPVLTGHLFGVAAFARIWCEANGKKLITLGTQSGNEEVFRPAEKDPDRDRRLGALFGDAGLGISASHFEPATLPLLWVPDREAALKQRIEDDRADRRISAGLLGLARQFTASIESRELARLFINLGSPLVQELLVADDAKARHAAAVLRALAQVGARGQTGLDRDLGEALTELSESLRELLRS